MQRVVIIRGHLTGPTSVELDEAITDAQGEVQVIVPRNNNGPTSNGESIHDFLKGLPAGTRSREDIDQQLRGEREDWGLFLNSNPI